MGMDVMNGSGVVVTLDQMISFIEKDKDKIFEIKPEIADSTGTVVGKLSLRGILLNAMFECIYDLDRGAEALEEEDGVPKHLKDAYEMQIKFIASEENGGSEGDPEHPPKIDEVIQTLKSIAAVEDLYGDGLEILSEHELENVWNYILHHFYPQLPGLDSVRCFNNSRLEGDDVPKGVPCFIFSSADCFEKKLTKKGESFKEAFGSCEESDWTIVSY